MENNAKLPLLVVVGPTASGKTSASVKIAKNLEKRGIVSEIICADSRTVYRGMDIGTAKITPEEMENIPHFGINIVNPDQRFTVADFQKYAKEKISEILSRDHMPIMVGGSGLYVDSVIFNYDFTKNDSREQESVREKLNKKSIGELQNFIIEHKIYMPDNKENKRYLIRSIEKNKVKNTTSDRNKIRENTIIVGITTNKSELRKRIISRAEKMLSNEDFELETKSLFAKYPDDSEPMKSNIYRFAKKFFEGEVDFDAAVNEASIADWHLAKKQLTWFRRNKNIEWRELNEVVDFSEEQVLRMTRKK